MPRGLPPGLTINPSTGVISGIPRQSGEYTFIVQAKDSQGTIAQREQTVQIYAINVTGDAPIGRESYPYPTYTYSATGGTGPYTYSLVSGSLPAGLTLNANGTITGTPTAIGTKSFTLKATDASRFDSQPLADSIQIVGAAYLVAADGVFYRIATSEDSETWTARVNSSLSGITEVIWDGTRFVAVRETSVLVSDDGITWTEAGTTPNTVTGIVFTGDVYVACGVASQTHTSSDLVTWTSFTYQNGGSSLSRIAWSGSRFMGVGANRTRVTSTDGLTWTRQNGFSDTAINDVCWGDGQFVMVKDNTVITSSDGLTLFGVHTFTSPTPTLSGIKYANGRYFVLGTDGFIATSVDLSSWTTQTSGVTTTLYDLVWTNNVYVVVGASNVILTSPDGETWTQRTSPLLSSVDYRSVASSLP